MAIPRFGCITGTLEAVRESPNFSIHHTPPAIGFTRVDEVSYESKFLTVIETYLPTVSHCRYIGSAAKGAISIRLSFH